MVTPNQEPEVEAVQAPLPEAEPEPDVGLGEFVPEVNPLIAEVDRLNSAPDIDISDVPEETPQEPVTENTIEEQPVEIPPEVPQQPQQPQLSPQQLQELQRQAAEYEQVRQRAAVQQQQTQVQRQLEAQGIEPQDAQRQAQQYVQSQGAQQDLVRQADQYGQTIIAKQNAAEHFANKYKLDFSDLSILKQAETPEIMESLAKEIQGRRSMESELQQLKKSQVPSQQYDNSQGAPEVASNDGNWLDRYNAGDRSPNAVAAAKRVLGI